ncbi:alpha-galactosidase [Turicibacter sanguinis]|uniref:alpha-galactosidase n=1 Tax=Turicibacter sanguinis TaxID=154288 RepID=UPI00232E322C|nr:alpha-galactosidase [Turicibacter sanguinis]MDB8575437.1 alpha-galactosidase [Turicibacter sanguinis]MDB8576723.1 alpha-galactosidase [Turicibacter sanguinis]MDB8582612.1 alpha-galactosidase [Turicibacter sanguinis]MDB8587385.1 alpha-galactosidase [Turicibacter sanguinis]MDB8597966.1 alpha-galactosidase [Turicibacter sanguinis]
MGFLIDEKRQLFGLETNKTTYAFAVDNMGLLRHLYWGPKVNNLEDFDVPALAEMSSNDPILDLTDEEYPVFGGMRYKEHCLKVNFADGTRDIEYRYVGYTQTEETLVIHLKDAHYEFEFDLHYKVYEVQDLIERTVSVRNTGNDIIEIEKVHSGQIHLPYQDLTLTSSHGRWLAEFQEFKQPLGQGKIVLENRRGISTHHHNPFFVLDHQASETNGEVYFGVLKLSGNFQTIIEPRPYGGTLVQMGISSHDCVISLQPGEEFMAPSMLVGYTNSGFEAMTHAMNDLAKQHVLRDGVRPVLYNSWEATEFDVHCDEQIALAKKAKEMGVELFVIDDGWFGQRHSDADGLGDWYVNTDKFPEGLTPLISAVKEMGMMFGIWIEPEMVNPPTQLLKDHPDWIYHFENRMNDTSRNQMVLNVTLPEVQEFIFNMIDDLLANYEIDYIKWDANRPISQTGISRDMWYRHIEAVYDIARRVKEKYPNLLLEACASGGGRVDYGMLDSFDDFWTSDNTDAYDRLTIQRTYSYVYPIKAMRAWVTDANNRSTIPLTFKFHSAMMGTLGMGCNILKFTEEEMELSRQLIEEYKEIRHIIQDGDFYRLNPITSNNYQVYEYANEDEAVLFVFLPQTQISRLGACIKIRGLDADARYEFNLSDDLIIKSGSYLMNHGIQVKLSGDYASTIIKFKKIA